MSTPRFFYFDMGNVLLLFDHELACRQVAQLADISSSEAREVLFESGLQDRYERGEVSSEMFYQQFCRRTDSRPEPAAFFRAASDIFRLNSPIVRAVQTLKSASRRIGVFSNTCPAHWEFCQDSEFRDLLDLFACYALSYELQAMKPEPISYQRAAALAGVSNEEIFFVDDRLENIEAARQAGWDAVQYQPGNTLQEVLETRGIHFEE